MPDQACETSPLSFAHPLQGSRMALAGNKADLAAQRSVTADEAKVGLASCRTSVYQQALIEEELGSLYTAPGAV